MYKLKNGVKLPKEFKIKVDESQSEVLQLHLFDIGISWCGKKEVCHLNRPYLYLNKDKMLENGFIESNFEKDSLPLINFHDYFDSSSTMNSEQITLFLKEHPLISQRGLETACKVPIGTIRHAMAGLRPIPEKHIGTIVDALRKYGFPS